MDKKNIGKRETIAILCLSLLLCFSIHYHPTPALAQAEPENLISLDVVNMDIVDVLKMIGEQSGLNIVSSRNVQGKVTVKLKDLPVELALKEILRINAFVYERDEKLKLIRVMTEQEYRDRYGKGPEDEVMVFELKYADIEKLATVLNQVKTKSGKIITDARTNTVVVVDTLESIANIEKIVKELDVEVLSRVFALSYAEATKIQEKLQKVMSKEGKVQVDESTNKITVSDIPANVELVATLIKEWDVPAQTVTRTFVLNYAKAVDLEAKVTAELTKDVGQVKVDERTNALVVIDRAEKIQKIASLISALDTKTRQILIETKIMETTLSDEQKLGIDWEYQSPETRPMEHHRDVKGDFSQALSEGGIFKIGTLGREEYRLTLEALRDSGNTKIISSPRLITLDDQTAKIVVGTEYPVATYELVQQTGTYEITGWELLEYGISLEVTPSVNEDNFITMTIKPEVSDAVGTVGTEPHERPIIETQQVTTQTMIKDGETIVIAGLIKDKKEKEVKKIPLIGSIPVLGVFFRKTTEKTTKTDLMIFITAHIIETEKEATDITSKKDTINSEDMRKKD